MAEIQTQAGPRRVEFTVHIVESPDHMKTGARIFTELLNDGWSIMSAVPVTQHDYSAVQYVLIREVVEEEPTTEEETVKE